VEDAAARRLAEALVDFDALLTLDVLDHVQARVEEWDGPNVRPPVAPGRRQQARRYRALADSIQSLSRVRVAHHPF
jgi:hypothetical protein